MPAPFQPLQQIDFGVLIAEAMILCTSYLVFCSYIFVMAVLGEEKQQERPD